MKRSWKTTTCAICAAVGVLAATVAALLDEDPSTTADWAGVVTAVGSALAALGIGGVGLVAKDDDKEGNA